MRKDIFTKESPFQTIEEYTQWWLEKRGLLDLTEEALQLNDEWYKYHLPQVPLDSQKNTPIDMMAVVEDEISANTYFDNSVNVEQFLVSGSVRYIGGEQWYMQGTESPRWMEAKYIQRQDAWEKSIS